MTDQTDDDFEKAFNEFSAKREGGDDPAPAPEAAPEEPNTLASAEPAAAAAEAAPQVQEPDELTKLKAELEAEREKLRRATGSISGYERHLQTERAERAKLEQALAQLTSKPNTQEQQDANDESLAYLKENFPELSTALEKVIETKLKGLDQRFTQVDARISEAVAPIAQKFEAESTARELDTLGKAHPDWQQVVNSQDFGGWLAGQPAPVQSLMDSPIASDAVWLLNQYKNGKNVAQQPLADVQAEVQARRQKELSQAAGVPVRSAGRPVVASDGDGSFESSFDFYSRQREARSANRR